MERSLPGAWRCFQPSAPAERTGGDGPDLRQPPSIQGQVAAHEVPTPKQLGEQSRRQADRGAGGAMEDEIDPEKNRSIEKKK